MSQREPNTVWARTFLGALASAGVKEICVAPGSRSTPLVLAAVEDGRFRLFSVLDERSAGFFALGIGRAARRPAAVITTSGTAAANLYPAVIEASQGEVPMLVITADRPHRLRDTDGNQSMDQLRLFGTYPRAFFEVAPATMDEASLRHLRGLGARAVSLSLGPPKGPVHLNFPFEKPLEPGRSASGDRELPSESHGGPRVSTGIPMVSEEELDWAAGMLHGVRRGLIVAGPYADQEELGPAALSLAAATGFPLLADPLSGARFGPKGGARVVGGYDLFLRSPEIRRALKPELIVRVGASPTSAPLLELLSEAADAVQIVVDDGHRWKDHIASAHHYVRAAPAPWLELLAQRVTGEPAHDWPRFWERAEATTRTTLHQWTAAESGALEGEIMAAVIDGLPEGAGLFVASSMPIRDLDAFGFPRSKALRVFGNRGVSGIDGLVSTTAGIAVGSVGSDAEGRHGCGALPTVGVLGDLAFLHDLNGLQALSAGKANVVLVVVNNDGGGIFHTLPIREYEPAFTRFFATPHGLQLEKAAELHGIPYSQARSLEEFEGLFSQGMTSGGPAILEVRTDREKTHRARRALVDAVGTAVAELGSE